MSESVSPGGQWRAVAYVRDCGATTWWVNNVSVVRNGQQLPRHGNVMELDDYEGRALLLHPIRPERGGLDVRLKWESDRDLNVVYPKEGRVFDQATRVHGITVHYLPTPNALLERDSARER